MLTQSLMDRLLKLNPPPSGIDPKEWAEILQMEADKRADRELSIQAIRETRLYLMAKKQQEADKNADKA